MVIAVLSSSTLRFIPSQRRESLLGAEVVPNELGVAVFIDPAESVHSVAIDVAEGTRSSVR